MFFDLHLFKFSGPLCVDECIYFDSISYYKKKMFLKKKFNFMFSRQIAGVLVIQRTDVCLQITGKTEEPMFSNAEIVRAVITCFRFRIANNTISAGELISQPHA